MSSRPARPSHQAFCPSLAPSRLASSRPRLQARRPRGPVACAAPPRAVTVVFTPDEIEEPAHVGECLGDVAARARVDLLINCAIGDCGSCEVERVAENGEKRIVRACVAAVPVPEEGAGDKVTYLTYPDDIW